MSIKYVIRKKSGVESEALSAEEIGSLIKKNEVDEHDEVAVQPGRVFVPIGTAFEFDKMFEATVVLDKNKHRIKSDDEKTKIINAAEVRDLSTEPPKTKMPARDESEWVDQKTKEQKTSIVEIPKELKSKDFNIPEKRKFGVPKKQFLVMIFLAIMLYEYMYEDEEAHELTAVQIVMKPIRPHLPGSGTSKINPELSNKNYISSGKYYIEDTVQGYRKAVQGLQLALSSDPQNVKALAMLASCYINLIDSSNKDENTFSVIDKLIELSRLKGVDLVETLIAEVEFLSISRRYDAAIQRLTLYKSISGTLDPFLFYYLGWLYVQKGDYANATKFLNLIPASALQIPKLYYLRGLISEENKDYDQARAEYSRALKYNPEHAKSILGIIRTADRKGELKSMVKPVTFLVAHPSTQSPPEYVSTLVYQSKLALIYNKPDLAVSSLETAISIEPRNEDLKLEYYSLLASGDKNTPYRNLARMYALVLESERLIKTQQYHEASVQILKAKEAFPKSEVPLEKMGDLFYQQGYFQKAKVNYEKALLINPKSTEIAVKLINALVQNHDYDLAQRNLAKYRNNPKIKSSVDRLAGDLAFQQQFYTQAVGFYRKAMARDTIDNEVYSSYANALGQLGQCKDAQFFYNIAQRLDPFSYGAIMGSAKCLLKTDNADAAIGRIQAELSKLLKVRADLLAGAAEIYYLANDFEKALKFVDQAKEVDPEYPESYKIEGLIFLKSSQSKKEDYKKALESFKTYSDRKISDPFGYVMRFELFLKDSNFELANGELNKIFEISPKFPELHYRRAQLLSKMGRSKEAIDELEEELKINPRLVKAMVELGGINVRLNFLDEANKNYVKAMQIEPQNAQAKIGAGYVNYLKRQFPSAIALYTAALSIDKGNPEIYKKLGLAYRDSGDVQRAAQAFRSYLDLAPDAPDRNEFEKYR